MTNIEPWPTEAAATAAVKAAAAEHHRLSTLQRWDESAQITGVNPRDNGAEVPEYDLLPEFARRGLEEQILPLVWAALQAIPDPRYAAWEQGYIAGNAFGYESAQDTYDGPPEDPTTNPYPSGA